MNSLKNDINTNKKRDLEELEEENTLVEANCTMFREMMFDIFLHSHGVKKISESRFFQYKFHIASCIQCFFRAGASNEKKRDYCGYLFEIPRYIHSLPKQPSQLDVEYEKIFPEKMNNNEIEEMKTHIETCEACSFWEKIIRNEWKQSVIGHVNSLKIGGVQFAENIEARIPTDYETDVVVGVINDFEWEGGLAQPLYFDVQITTSNKGLAETLIMNTLDSTEVVIGFTIYNYDHDAKKYFIFQKGEELEGNIFEDNGTLSLEIDAEADTEVQLPRNYNFKFAVAPAAKEQDIIMATSRDMKFVCDWGVTI